MGYDYDLIVIGAGPAGLAAAIRARWVKNAEAISASVCVLDPAGPGGIAALGQINLTGPGFGFTGPELTDRLLADVHDLEIPLLREAAVAVRREPTCWRVVTPAGALRALAVVVAVGLRRMTVEPELRAAGRLAFLAGGYARAAHTFRTWSRSHEGQHAYIIGGAGLDITPFLVADEGRNLIQVALDESKIQNPKSKIFLDYHSLELAPPGPAFLPNAWRTDSGYLAFGPAGRDDLPGIFAAGDCAGMPSLCLKALAQGAEAGFHAYRYIHHRKFGAEPPLFAFFPSEERPPLDASDLPAIDPARHRPVALTQAAGDLADPDVLAAALAAKTATVHLIHPQG